MILVVSFCTLWVVAMALIVYTDHKRTKEFEELKKEWEQEQKKLKKTKDLKLYPTLEVKEK